MKIVDFVNEKSSNDIISNTTISEDEVVASYGPPWSLFHTWWTFGDNLTIKSWDISHKCASHMVIFIENGPLIYVTNM